MGWPLCWWTLGSYLVYSSLKTSDDQPALEVGLIDWGLASWAPHIGMCSAYVLDRGMAQDLGNQNLLG